MEGFLNFVEILLYQEYHFLKDYPKLKKKKTQTNKETNKPKKPLMSRGGLQCLFSGSDRVHFLVTVFPSLPEQMKPNRLFLIFQNFKIEAKLWDEPLREFR